MRRLFCYLIAVLILMPAAILNAQDRPNFSGQWTITPDAPAGSRAPRGDMGSGWGSPITVTQNDATLTVQYAFFGRGDMQPPFKFVYALNGSETRNTVMMGHGIQAMVSKTRWEGNKLIITTVHTFTDPQTGKPATTEVRQTLSLESPKSLQVETTRNGALGGTPSISRSVYTRN
jgi:hypothetical protein